MAVTALAFAGFAWVAHGSWSGLAFGALTWEMAALRGWVVAFLTFCAVQAGSGWTPIAPATGVEVRAV